MELDRRKAGDIAERGKITFNSDGLWSSSYSSEVLEFGNGGGQAIQPFFKGVERLGGPDKSSATDR